eukprot:gb/GEZN01003528.1/.p1 GENE.gb/GEZN01003528.1/~~gb/GEZN01003528.1/.p1  ORF type:complete len:695 (-),score=6.81 gb/GEZN01003528.1/:7-2091(-)
MDGRERETNGRLGAVRLSYSELENGKVRPMHSGEKETTIHVSRNGSPPTSKRVVTNMPQTTSSRNEAVGANTTQTRVGKSTTDSPSGAAILIPCMQSSPVRGIIYPVKKHRKGNTMNGNLTIDTKNAPLNEKIAERLAKDDSFLLFHDQKHHHEHLLTAEEIRNFPNRPNKHMRSVTPLSSLGSWRQPKISITPQSGRFSWIMSPFPSFAPPSPSPIPLSAPALSSFPPSSPSTRDAPVGRNLSPLAENSSLSKLPSLAALASARSNSFGSIESEPNSDCVNWPQIPAEIDRSTAVFQACTLGVAYMVGTSELFANLDIAGRLYQEVDVFYEWRDYSGLPGAAIFLASAVAVFPVGLMLNQHGYRNVFLFGGFISIAGSLMCCAAIIWHKFLLLVAGIFVQGFAQGFVNYYRHAAASEFGPLAGKDYVISIVLTGGVFGCILGPYMVARTHKLLGHKLMFLPSFAILAGTNLVHIIILWFQKGLDGRICPRSDSARPVIRRLIQNKNYSFFLAAWASTWAQVTMSMLMVLCLFTFDTGNEWGTNIVFTIHVVFMFVPSAGCPYLIHKLGHELVMSIGFLLIFIGLTVALVGGYTAKSPAAYSPVMAVVGIGWNFAYIAGTSMLNDTHSPQEKFVAQALHDTLVYSTTAIFSYAVMPIFTETHQRGVYAVIVTMLMLAFVGLWVLRWCRGYMYNI